LVENSLKLKDLIKLSKEIRNVKLAVIDKFGMDYKEVFYFFCKALL